MARVPEYRVPHSPEPTLMTDIFRIPFISPETLGI